VAYLDNSRRGSTLAACELHFIVHCGIGDANKDVEDDFFMNFQASAQQYVS
jgi:hypothetical protein